MDILSLSPGAITAIGVSLLAVLGLIGLIVWNYRAKEQSRALKSIDARMKESKQDPVSADILLQISAHTQGNLKTDSKPGAENAEKAEIHAGGETFDEETFIETEDESNQKKEESLPAHHSAEIAFSPEIKADPISPDHNYQEDKGEATKAMDNNYNVGKSGKIYSRSELQELIRN